MCSLEKPEASHEHKKTLAMAASAPSHAQLRYAIFEYLQNTVRSGGLTEEQTEGLEVAVQCISEAFGFSADEDVPSGAEQHELSLKPLTLPVIFNTGVQVLSGPSSATPGSPAKTASGSALSAANGADGSDDQMFQKFVATLRDRGFFAGLTEGTVSFSRSVLSMRAPANNCWVLLFPMVYFCSSWVLITRSHLPVVKPRVSF